MPSPEDIHIFKKYLDNVIASMDFSVVTWSNYKGICEILQTKITTYNRRRPLEVESIRYIYRLVFILLVYMIHYTVKVYSRPIH